VLALEAFRKEVLALELRDETEATDEGPAE
jgi:hypothetical protein